MFSFHECRYIHQVQYNTTLIQACGKVILSKLVAEINEAGLFSVLAEEATDNNNDYYYLFNFGFTKLSHHIKLGLFRPTQ